MPPQITCPACSTPVPPGALQCRSCKLEVGKMTAYAAAMRAAGERGVHRTMVEVEREPLWFKLSGILPVIVLVVVIGGLMIYYFTRPPSPPAWTKYPSTPTAAAEELMKVVATDDLKVFAKGYALIPESARNKENKDEEGHYYQIFRTLNHYLREEFGSDWHTRMKFVPDKDNPNVVAVHIDAETIHVLTDLQTPADLVNETNKHYGVGRILEWDVAEANELQKVAGITGVVGAYGGGAAVENLQSILSVGRFKKESKTLTKLRILPTLRNPRMLARMSLLQSWPLRTDPVIRHRLEQIVRDERYEDDVRQTADQILKETVPEEDLIAAGVG